MDFNIPENLTGLTDEQVLESRAKFGENKMKESEKSTWFSLSFGYFKRADAGFAGDHHHYLFGRWELQ